MTLFVAMPLIFLCGGKSEINLEQYINTKIHGTIGNSRVKCLPVLNIAYGEDFKELTHQASAKLHLLPVDIMSEN